MEDILHMFETAANADEHIFYRLEDGRLWSVDDAAFVSSVPEGANVYTCPDEDGKLSLKGLVACLHFYGYELGELKTDAEFAAEARGRRDAMLAETDYLMMPDYPLDDGKKAAILAYRQALRDVPEQAGFPRQIDWPAKP